MGGFYFPNIMSSAIVKIGEKIQALQEELHDLNYRYHSLGETPVPDHEFDTKLRALEVLEKDYPQFHYLNSPTARIGGAEVAGFPEVKHRAKMLSLEKVFSASELLTWLGKRGAVTHVEPKVDGLALELTYDEGTLLRAVTRGDGSVGADMTQNARAIATIPLQLRARFNGTIRGEVYMSKESFATCNAKLVEEGEDEMANPRNAVVGTFKSKDPKVVAARKLDFIAYGPCHPDELKRLGFKFTQPLGMFTAQMEQEHINQLLAHFRGLLSSLPFECDGLVVKIMDQAVRDNLGDSNTAPKWAVAFKYPPQRVRTSLRDIKLSVGRTGRICPNAVLTPVTVAGTKVSAATLHNEDQVKRLGVAIGDDIWLEKAGEIIPAIVGRASDVVVDYSGCESPDAYENARKAAELAHAWTMPATFTDSRGKEHLIVRNDGEVVHRLASPEDCQDCAHAQLEHMTGKTCLDWDGLGSEHCLTLVGHGVRNLADLMRIAPEATGLSGKVLERFVAARADAKTTALWRVFYALSPEGIGRTYSKQLAALARNHEAITGWALWRLEELIGPDKAATLHAELPKMAKQMAELVALGMVLDDDKLASNGGPQQLKGLVFCVTGTLTKSRDAVIEIIEAAGGLCKSSCGKATAYLIAGDDPGATKIKAAEKYGVKVIGETELYALMNHE